MRYPASEKAEIIQLVEQSRLPVLALSTTDGVRGDIAQEIISIVRQVANGPASSRPTLTMLTAPADGRRVN